MISADATRWELRQLESKELTSAIQRIVSKRSIPASPVSVCDLWSGMMLEMVGIHCLGNPSFN